MIMVRRIVVQAGEEVQRHIKLIDLKREVRFHGKDMPLLMLIFSLTV